MSKKMSHQKADHTHPTASTGRPDNMMLKTFYAAAYDYLKNYPEFDGRPHPSHPGMLLAGVGPDQITPWAGAVDVPHMSRDAWVTARLEAVRRGDEEPAIRLNGGGKREP